MMLTFHIQKTGFRWVQADMVQSPGGAIRLPAIWVSQGGTLERQVCPGALAVCPTPAPPGTGWGIGDLGDHHRRACPSGTELVPAL